MIGLERRGFLKASASVVGVGLASARASAQENAASTTACAKLSSTPSWDSPVEYKWGAPERTSLLELDIAGLRISLSGKVLTTCGVPLSDARFEFWHADPDGHYDYVGYKFRGVQRTGPGGSYKIETIMPGIYNNNIRHIHYCVGAHMPGKDRATQSLLKSFVINFPTQEQFDRATPSDRASFISPSAIVRQAGILTTSYDIIFELS